MERYEIRCASYNGWRKVKGKLRTDGWLDWMDSTGTRGVSPIGKFRKCGQTPETEFALGLKTVTALEACKVAVRMLKHSDAWHLALDATAKYSLGDLIMRAIKNENENDKEKQHDKTRDKPTPKTIRSTGQRARKT